MFEMLHKRLQNHVYVYTSANCESIFEHDDNDIVSCPDRKLNNTEALAAQTWS